MASVKFFTTLPRWGSMRNGVVTRQREWGRLTGGSASSCWPTATGTDSKASGSAGYSTESGRHEGVTLTDAIRQWPTPDASLMNDGADPDRHRSRLQRLKARGINGNGAGTPLAMAVKKWPTPTSHERSHTPRHVDHGAQLANVVRDWSTPNANDWKGSSQPGQRRRQLSEGALTWPTPTAGCKGPGGEGNREGVPTLQTAAAGISWPTPNAQGGTGYMSGSNRDTWRPTLEGMATGARPVLHHGRPDRTTVRDGAPSLSGGPGSPRRLNPDFVDFLMGLPHGWTACVPLETGAYPWWRRWHSLILRIVRG